MKRSIKISLIIIIALVLLACLVALMLRSRPDEPVAATVSDTSGGPSFEVHVVRPRVALPLFGLLDDGQELRFDHTSRGAEIGSVRHDRLELSAEGWNLFIEIDSEGRVAPGTRLVFPIELGGRRVRMRCRPADPGVGHLNTTTLAGSDELGGRFIVQFATCENAESGKTTEWPPAPLTVRGSFNGLPHGRR
jgi:hypothetical protein